MCLGRLYYWTGYCTNVILCKHYSSYGNKMAENGRRVAILATTINIVYYGDGAQEREQTAGSVAEAGNIMFVTIVIAIFTS